MEFNSSEQIKTITSSVYEACQTVIDEMEAGQVIQYSEFQKLVENLTSIEKEKTKDLIGFYVKNTENLNIYVGKGGGICKGVRVKKK